MKWTILSMLLVAARLAGLALHKGDGALQEGLKTAAVTFGKFLPILAVAFLIMGMVDVLLPQEVVEKWLSESSGWRGLGAAWAAGVITPGGSIIAMPLAAGLLKAGVGPSVLVTYLTSIALLSYIRIPLEVGFFGWHLTLLRITASLVLPIGAGLIARWLAPLFMGGSPPG